MKQLQCMISLSLILLLLLCIPISSQAETQSNWNEENYNPSRLTDEECFPITGKAYVARFNQKYSGLMEFVEEGTRCNLYLAGKQKNIFLQFMDTSDPIFQFGSGLARNKWNKVRVYMATDDSTTDEEFLTSFSSWFPMLSDILGYEFDAAIFTEGHLPNTGSYKYPQYTHEERGLRYTLEAYDDRVMFGGEVTTTYSASIMLIPDSPESFVENGRFTFSAQEFGERLKGILGDGWTVITTLDTTTTDTPTAVTDIENKNGASARIIYGGRDYFVSNTNEQNSFDLLTAMIMADSSDPMRMIEIGVALVQAVDPKADATRTITLITDLVEEGQKTGEWEEKTQNGIKYNYSNVVMPISYLFMISVAD